MIYLRVIDGEIFEWLLIFNKELYAGYLVITPEKGKDKLTDTQINQAAALALQGALTTIDMKLGIKPDKKSRQVAEAFEKTRKAVENLN